MKIAALTLAAVVIGYAHAQAGSSYINEIKLMDGHKMRSKVVSPLPHTYLDKDDLPENFSWDNVDGKSYLTKMLNQHIPHYCGSCWAHGAISSLQDRIKIARGGVGHDINLSIQFILNCGAESAGSCPGGSHTGVDELIHEMGYIPFETCQPYLACSEESEEGFCPQIDTSCSMINTCRTCSGFSDSGGHCVELPYFPNATVAEWGEIGGSITPKEQTHKIKAEIFARGPVACTINADPLRNYPMKDDGTFWEGGVIDDEEASQSTNHIVSITGWGKDEKTGKDYWIIRNSWGEYWGEMGFAKIAAGKNMLGMEDNVAWVTPSSFTIQNSLPCSEDGAECGGIPPAEQKFSFVGMEYVDPSVEFLAKKEAKDAQNNLRVSTKN
jgi:cathepsin X